MNSATVAAITAAVVSFVGVIVNVFWTYRLSSRAQLGQWRRNEERPVIARIVTLSKDALEQWDRSAQARQDWIDSRSADPTRGHEDTAAKREAAEFRGAGSELYDKLRFEVAQLDLTAGPALRDVAARLAAAHESMQSSLLVVRPEDLAIDLFVDRYNKIVGLNEEFVEKARIDLGLGSST